MLTDAEIDHAARELADYRRDDVLSRVLTKYGSLLDDYRRLKSDYEEERETRERYKKLAKEQERNPYAMVLVDGDGYVFQDLLVQKGSDDGGGNAARALNEAVRASLQTKGLDHCQIMVRVYADVAGVSKALNKAGLCGPEKRSLAPFVANFNRSFGHTDFVDAGDLKENADFKLRALLRLHADNPQCKHIYFAACHDVGYISELTPHKGDHGRFTLVRTPGVNFHPQFTKLDMGIENFPGVFRSTPLDMAMQLRSQRAGSTPITKTTTMSTMTRHSSIGDDPRDASPGNEWGGMDTQKVCKFYPQGKCKYGNGCKNAHISDRLSSVTSWRGASRGNIQSARDFDADELRTTTGRHELQQKNAHYNHGRLNDEGGHSSAPGYIDLSGLPKKENIPTGFVAVNQDDFRLDAYLSPVSSTVQSELRARIKSRPVCNKWHLTDSCPRGDDCYYDHAPLNPSAKRALELLARSLRCQAGGKCRNSLCTKGHICQNQQCKYYGGGDPPCKLPYRSHKEDLNVASFQPAVVPSQLQYDNGAFENMSQTNESVDDGPLEEDHIQDSDYSSNGGGTRGQLTRTSAEDESPDNYETYNDAHSDDEQMTGQQTPNKFHDGNITN